MRSWSRIVVLALIVFLVGCGKVPLHHKLGEIEADKILVLLDKNGIDANKERQVEGQDVSWTVLVSQADTSKARRLLVENNLPQRPELGLAGVYKEKGLIPTPDEQRARFLLALKGEIINALRKIPGIHEVGVVLNVPVEKELQFGDEEEVRPSASVVLRIADPRMLHEELTEAKIKRFVANAIPEMDPKDVIVIISSQDKGPADVKISETLPPPPLKVEKIDGGGSGPDEGPPADYVTIGGIQLDPGSLTKFRVYLIIFLIVLILLSTALLVTLFRFSRIRRHSGSRRLKAVPIEGQPVPDLLGAGQETLHPGGGPGETGTGR